MTTAQIITAVRYHLQETTELRYFDAQILQVANEAQNDIVQRARPEWFPALLEEISGTLAAAGTVALPADFLFPIAVQYGASALNAPIIMPTSPLYPRLINADPFVGGTSSLPKATVVDGLLRCYPAGAVAYKLTYLKLPPDMVSAGQAPTIPASMHGMIVDYATAQVLMSDDDPRNAADYLAAYEARVQELK